MNVALLEKTPVSPSSELGPYRRWDYEALPPEPRCELIYGSLYVSPSPSPLHQTVAALLFEALRQTTRSQGGRVFFAPLDVYLNEHSVVQPDLFYVSSERRSIVGERVEGAPDLLVEILSPGTARQDRGEKLRLYGESDVREYWIVDPGEKQIEFLENEDGHFVVRLAVDGQYRSRALPQIVLDLDGLWQALDREIL
jgi:Uma2 family endonuclease